jgi:hypothetical protein
MTKINCRWRGIWCALGSDHQIADLRQQFNTESEIATAADLI